jgi:hypothetical protein
MNRTERTKLKRKYRRNLWIAFSCIFTFVLAFVGLMIFAVDAPLSVRIITGITIAIALIVGFISNVNADWTHRDLMKYKADVRDYRARRLFIMCLDLIDAGKFREAGDLYNCIPSGHNVRDYLYPILIHEFRKSDDPELKERGTRRMKEFREFYEPNKVNIKR